MEAHSTYLVLGATGGTGRHFVRRALADGHRVRALVRNPDKLTFQSDRLDVRQGSLGDPGDLDTLVAGVDFIVMMVGDKDAQRHAEVSTPFVKKLVPAMRRQGVARLLYQAGGLSRPPGKRLGVPFWLILHVLARSYIGQHRDNEAVMAYLAAEASDIEWMVHRAGIGSDGTSKGSLYRSNRRPSIATFKDCADYNYCLIGNESAIHTMSFSRYG